MSSPPQSGGLPPDQARVLKERDFYWRLLRLGDELEPFLQEALELIVAISGAQRGYLELLEDRDGDGAPRFWIAHGCYDEEVDAIRATFSRGVIAEAIATGKTILIESALADPRFFGRGSVQRNRTKAVLCAPIGECPPIGVLYLQDRTTPEPFTEADRERSETFARHLAPLADRLLTRRRRRDEADHTAALRKNLRVDTFIGRSLAAAKLLQQLAQAAPLDVGVLLTGLTGTGKTQLARLIHENSTRASGPFVELNCSAIPEQLVESELFGALPGAHSTAMKRVEGKVAAATGGTLFLDEVSELNPGAQAKLLQLLESKEYYPLGSSRPIRANVRIIAATNKDLKAEVARKAFREDLYYRLQVLPIRVPSLAERREDLPALAAHFCARACARHRLPAVRLSAGALRAIDDAKWDGNLRELANKVESASIRAAWESVEQIEPRHLFPDAAGEEDPQPEGAPSLQEGTRRFQKRFVASALEATSWNVTEAAKHLDVARAHVYNLIRAFGLRRPQ
jgi:Nif-specific regulatory protein